MESTKVVKRSKSSGKKTGKTGKAAKDPNRPKRPMTAYILFSNEKRSEIRSQKPDLKATEVTKELGRLWNQSNEQIKDKYKALAENDKKRYQSEAKEYASRQKDGLKAKSK